ncbi:MAG: hypothetical protein RJA81_1906 [Planctomycetota bacterium]
MLLKITHKTTLSYSKEVSGTIFEARMGPRSDDDQTTLSYALYSSPSAPVTSYRDGDGNRIDLFNIIQSFDQLQVDATSFVRTHRRDALSRLLSDPSERQTPIQNLSMEMRELLKPSPLIPLGQSLREFGATLNWTDNDSARDRAMRLLDSISSRLIYQSDVTNAWTSVDEVLELNRGVCQDFAHALIGLARIKGMPARYVSGYIHQPGQIATHAWAQVWFGPRIGWIDLDPTREGFANNEHVTVAYGRDYSDVPPNRGIWSGDAIESIHVAVEITPTDSLPSDHSIYTPRKKNQIKNHHRFLTSRKPFSIEKPRTWPQSVNTLARQPFQPSSHPQQTQQQQS